jgi:hypothetical protein
VKVLVEVVPSSSPQELKPKLTSIMVVIIRNSFPRIPRYPL